MNREDIRVGAKVIPLSKKMDCVVDVDGLVDYYKRKKYPLAKFYLENGFLIVKEIDDNWVVLKCPNSTGGDFFEFDEIKPLLLNEE